jgi:hypothetical protein
MIEQEREREIERVIYKNTFIHSLYKYFFKLKKKKINLNHAFSLFLILLIMDIIYFRNMDVLIDIINRQKKEIEYLTEISIKLARIVEKQQPQQLQQQQPQQHQQQQQPQQQQQQPQQQQQQAQQQPQPQHHQLVVAINQEDMSM